MTRKMVLLVEDDAALRSLFCNALVIAGFAVREAADGMEALRLIDSAPPDVIVLDLGLPHVTGYDVLYELRQHSHTNQIPVVIITGSNDPLDDANPDCILRKPVDPEKLIRIVERCARDNGRK